MKARNAERATSAWTNAVARKEARASAPEHAVAPTPLDAAPRLATWRTTAPSSTRRAQRFTHGLALACGTLACAALAGACSTQRWPQPMGGLKGGARAETVAGSDEVQVLRHGDPVEVRPAGTLGSYPLRFYRKQERLRSGSVVLVGASGKAEIVWPGLAATATLLGEAVVTIGEASAGEPALKFQALESARLTLVPAHSIALLGGALLYGDPNEEASGPFLVERIDAQVLRVRNQSRASGRVSYRDEEIELLPGQLVDLAILGAGSAPQDHEAQPRVVDTAAGSVRLEGQIDARADGDALAIRSSGGGTASARGVKLLLPSGASARFTNLRASVGAAPAGAAATEPAVTEPLVTEPAAKEPAGTEPAVKSPGSSASDSTAVEPKATEPGAPPTVTEPTAPTLAPTSAPNNAPNNAPTSAPAGAAANQRTDAPTGRTDAPPRRTDAPQRTDAPTGRADAPASAPAPAPQGNQPAPSQSQPAVKPVPPPQSSPPQSPPTASTSTSTPPASGSRGASSAPNESKNASPVNPATRTPSP